MGQAVERALMISGAGGGEDRDSSTLIIRGKEWAELAFVMGEHTQPH